jgi:hypothetical protein
MVHQRFSSGKLPDVGIKRAGFFLNFKKNLRIPDGSPDFGPVTDNAGIAEQAVIIFFGVGGNLHRVKIIERPAKTLSSVQYGFPAQAGLKGIEHKELEEFSIVMNGHSPFSVVVFNHQRVVARPGTGFHCGFRILDFGFCLSRETAIAG